MTPISSSNHMHDAYHVILQMHDAYHVSNQMHDAYHVIHRMHDAYHVMQSDVQCVLRHPSDA